MCLIAYASKDRSQIPNVNLMRAHHRNDDAWGIMFPQSGRVQIVKDTTGHPQFLEAWKRTPLKTPIAAHFRYGTSGSMGPQMAHPFPVIEDASGVSLAVMHNGVLTCVADEGDLSDTAVLIRDVIQPQLIAKPDLVEIDGWRKAIGGMLGDDNKLLFMRGDGRVFFVNGWQGKFEKGGVWYSNTYSIAPPYIKETAKPLSGWSDFDGYFGSGCRTHWAETESIKQDPSGVITVTKTTTAAGAVVVRKPYQDPIDNVEPFPEPLPDLWDLSESELYNWICENNAEDVCDAIIEMRGGR